VQFPNPLLTSPGKDGGRVQVNMAGDVTRKEDVVVDTDDITLEKVG
jgi:hypothetical protein